MVGGPQRPGRPGRPRSPGWPFSQRRDPKSEIRVGRTTFTITPDQAHALRAQLRGGINQLKFRCHKESPTKDRTTFSRSLVDGPMICFDIPTNQCNRVQDNEQVAFNIRAEGSTFTFSSEKLDLEEAAAPSAATAPPSPARQTDPAKETYRNFSSARDALQALVSRPEGYVTTTPPWTYFVTIYVVKPQKRSVRIAGFRINFGMRPSFGLVAEPYSFRVDAKIPRDWGPDRSKSYNFKITRIEGEHGDCEAELVEA